MEAIAKATWEMPESVKDVLNIGVRQPHTDLLPREKLAQDAARALLVHDSRIVSEMQAMQAMRTPQSYSLLMCRM